MSEVEPIKTTTLPLAEDSRSSWTTQHFNLVIMMKSSFVMMNKIYDKMYRFSGKKKKRKKSLT